MTVHRGPGGHVPERRRRCSPCSHGSACLANRFPDSPDGPRHGDGTCRCLYAEVCRLAASMLRRAGSGASLEPGDLVHLTYVRLLTGRRADWESRAHFFGAAARAMEQSLVDHLRSRGRGGWIPASALDLPDASPPAPGDWEGPAAGEALRALEGHDTYLAAVVRLRVFTDLTMDQIAEVLAVSPRTLDRDWALARAWLTRRISEQRQ